MRSDSPGGCSIFSKETDCLYNPQPPLDNWYDYLSDLTLVDAILKQKKYWRHFFNKPPKEEDILFEPIDLYGQKRSSNNTARYLWVVET